MLLQNLKGSRKQSLKTPIIDTSNQFCTYSEKRSPRAVLFSIWGLGTHPPPILAQNGSAAVIRPFNHVSFSYGPGGGLHE